MVVPAVGMRVLLDGGLGLQGFEADNIGLGRGISAYRMLTTELRSDVRSKVVSW